MFPEINVSKYKVKYRLHLKLSFLYQATLNGEKLTSKKNGCVRWPLFMSEARFGNFWLCFAVHRHSLWRSEKCTHVNDVQVFVLEFKYR